MPRDATARKWRSLVARSCTVIASGAYSQEGLTRAGPSAAVRRPGLLTVLSSRRARGVSRAAWAAPRAELCGRRPLVAERPDPRTTSRRATAPTCVPPTSRSCRLRRPRWMRTTPAAYPCIDLAAELDERRHAYPLFRVRSVDATRIPTSTSLPPSVLTSRRVGRPATMKHPRAAGFPFGRPAAPRVCRRV
jgi:hypothetical protein